MTDENLIKLDSRRELAKSNRLYLMNLANGRVFSWTAYLAVRQGFVDCTIDGQPINPADVPGDHPWIQEQTGGLRDRLKHAGADEDSLYQVGQQLIADGERKFYSLEYKQAKTYRLESAKSASQAGALVRIFNNIDKACARAHQEIVGMVWIAKRSHGIKL